MQETDAVQLFIKAYAALQAQAARAELRQGDGLAWLHFGDATGAPIADEVIAAGLTPASACQRIAALAPGLPHWLTIFTAEPEQVHAECLKRGYRFQEGEFLMTRGLELEGLPPADGRARRVERAGLLERINQARGYRTFTAAQLDDPALDIAALEVAGQAAAWGAGLMVEEDCLYITNMYTLPGLRRRGYGGAVLNQLLRWGTARGARRSLLVSSQLGRGLYLGMGYQERLRCLVFRKE